MSHRKVIITAIAATLAVIGGWTGVSLANGGSSSSEDVVDASPGAEPPPPSGRNLSVDESRLADAEYAQWLETKEARSVDVSKLERRETESEEGRPLETDVEGAADQASVIVRGVVSEIRFVPSGTLTRVKIDKEIKGSVGAILTYVQRSKLQRTLDGKSLYLAEDIGEPFLGVGDRAVLMFKEATGTESKRDLAKFASERREPAPDRALRVMANIGQYRIEDGKIKTNKYSLTRSANGMDSEMFVDRVEARERNRSGG